MRRYGADSPFARYLQGAKPFLLLVLDIRNTIEHPKSNKYIEVSDFRVLPSGQTIAPSVEIVRPDGEAGYGRYGLDNRGVDGASLYQSCPGLRRVPDPGG